MGNQLASYPQTLQTDYYLHDLPGIVFEGNLGKGRFLKTLRCIHIEEGTIVVKVYIKRDQSQNLKDQTEKLTEIKENISLVEGSNVLAFTKWVETEKAGYLMRQYFINNLYDRISTRPFLTNIEKKWIVYQLLNALNQAHFYGICHGDIKCENVMVTSWNWIYLADFASYKPTFIPEDNPADFSFFFDTSGRRTCYLAPERFQTGTDIKEGDLTSEMDIFSVGCVIAELFLEGSPIFNFSQLLSYRKGEYDPTPIINRISDVHIQNLVKHMIQREPSKRFAAAKYLSNWTPSIFPPYFGYLHKYVSHLIKLDSDDKVETIRNDFDHLLKIFTGEEPHDIFPFLGEEKRKRPVNNFNVTEIPINASGSKKRIYSSYDSSLNATIKKPVNDNSLAKEFTPDTDGQLLLNIENYTQRLETSIKQEALLSPSNFSSNMNDDKNNSRVFQKIPIINSVEQFTSQIEKPVFIPPVGSEGYNIVMNVLCSFIHTVRFPSSYLTALELFSLFSNLLDSELRLQRIVPYIISLLTKESALVRATGIRTLTDVLEKITTFPPSDSHIFPAYILPSLARFSFANEESEELVREAYAECLARLAETAKNYLEASQQYKQKTASNQTDKDVITAYQESYDLDLAEVQDAFHEIVMEMLGKDPSRVVRKAVLSDIMRLCLFFGRQKTNDCLLPLIISVLNERWELKYAFYQNIVGIGSFLGMESIDQFILPCIVQSLTDEEEFVIDKAVNSLAAFAELSLLKKHKLFEIAEKASPMLFHPNTWIRYAVISLIAAIASQLNLADIHCFLIPVIKPFLMTEIVDITASTLLEALHPPVSRDIFDIAMAQAFDSLGMPNNSSDSIENIFSSKINSLNTSHEEEEKLFKMKSFILSAAQSKKGKTNQSSSDEEITTTFNSLSTTIQIYSVTYEGGKMTSRIRPTNSQDARKLVPTKNEEWKIIFGQGGTSPRPISKQAVNELASPSKRVSSDPLTINLTPSNSNSPAIGGNSLVSPLLTSPSKSFHSTNLPRPLFPPAAPDFGALSIDPPSGDSLRDFQPKGILVAHLHEHKNQVNEVVVSPDHLFFASASDDGTVKIWDSLRLEKHVTNRSRLTYTQGGKIKALTVCENSHSIASGSDNGTIHVFRVEFTAKKDNMNKFTSVTNMKVLDQIEEGPIVGLDHFNSDVQSLLVFGTNRGRIHGWDLRAKKEAFLLSNPPKCGLLSAFVLEPNHNWIVTGTCSGYFTCWDLRFQIPVKTWRHPDKTRIYKISYFYRDSNSQILSSSSNSQDVHIWNVQSSIPTQVIRVNSEEETGNLFSSTLSSSTKPSLDNSELTEYTEINANSKSSINFMGTKALLNPKGCNYLITGGDDKRIRYWNFANISNSYTISGLPSGYPKSKYLSTPMEDLLIHQEIPNSEDIPIVSPKKGPTFPTVAHKESILDLKLLEHPHRMLISASRDGIIKVWK